MNDTPDTAETPTPRTDEQEFYECGNYDVNWADFARQLERELHEATQLNNRLVSMVERTIGSNWREMLP